MSVYHTLDADFVRSARFLRISSWHFGVKNPGLTARWWIAAWCFVTKYPLFLVPGSPKWLKCCWLFWYHNQWIFMSIGFSFSLHFLILHLVTLCCRFALALGVVCVPFLQVRHILGWPIWNLCIGIPVRILLLRTWMFLLFALYWGCLQYLVAQGSHWTWTNPSLYASGVSLRQICFKTLQSTFDQYCNSWAYAQQISDTLECSNVV